MYYYLVHLQFNAMAGATDWLKKFCQFRLALELLAVHIIGQ